MRDKSLILVMQELSLLIEQNNWDINSVTISKGIESIELNLTLEVPSFIVSQSYVYRGVGAC